VSSVASGTETLKRWRRERGASQHDLAVAVGLTAGAISQFERGIHTPRRRVVEAMDSHLHAGGELLVAFGYVTPQHDGELAELRQQVADLTQMVTDLGATVATLGAEVARLRRSPRQPGSGIG